MTALRNSNYAGEGDKESRNLPEVDRKTKAAQEGWPA